MSSPRLFGPSEGSPEETLPNGSAAAPLQMGFMSFSLGLAAWAWGSSFPRGVFKHLCPFFNAKPRASRCRAESSAAPPQPGVLQKIRVWVTGREHYRLPGPCSGWAGLDGSVILVQPQLPLAWAAEQKSSRQEQVLSPAAPASPVSASAADPCRSCCGALLPQGSAASEGFLPSPTAAYPRWDSSAGSLCALCSAPSFAPCDNCQRPRAGTPSLPQPVFYPS